MMMNPNAGLVTVIKAILSSILLLSGIWPACNPAGIYAKDKLSLLTRAASVRTLSADQALLGYPVRLQGFVTYYDPDLPILFIQDESDGILVELEQQIPSLASGQPVEVSGISAPGGILPIVAKARLKLLNINGFPSIRKVPISRLDFRRDDCHWLQTEGIVHNAFQEGSHSVLEVYEGRSRIQIRIRALSQTAASSLIDARIEVKGVLAVTADSARKPIGFVLRVPSEREISILTPAPTAPKNLPVTSIRELEKSWKSNPPQHRIRIQGTVMPGDKADTLLIRDSTGVIEARTLFTRPIDPGDEADVIGFADLGSTIPRIINATYLRIKALAIQSKEEKGLPTLTGIRQIRRLTAQEAARGYPIRVRGLITYHDPQLSMTFIQDGGDAIYLQSLDPILALEEGKKYEVQGFSAPGDFAPIIIKPEFRLIGSAALPPAVSLTLDQLSTGLYDCLRVRVQGIVRSVRQVGNRWCLELFSDGKQIQVWLPNRSDSANVHSLQDARITAEGICSIQISDRGNINGFRVNVPSISGIHLIEQAVSDPFSIPLRPIRDVFRYSSQREAGHRVRIQGVLLHQQPGRALYVKDDTGSIVVTVDHMLPVNSSDLLTISGYPEPGEFAPFMHHALVRRLSSQPPQEPRVLEDSYALNNHIHGDLVKIRAELVDQWRNSAGQSYLLQDLNTGSTAFEALLESSSYRSPPPEIRNGSKVELTGIYLLQEKAAEKYGFLLLLRTPEDIRVLKSAPWWTLKHTYWTIGILFLLIVSALTWIAMLRKRVTRQTEIIRHQVEAEAALEKKYRELFERSNDIVFACDRTGRPKSINPAGMRILKYDIQDLLQMDPEHLVEPASLPKIREWIEQKLKGIESPHLECDLLARDGLSIPVEVNAEIIYEDGKPAGVQGIARDITERRQAEETLRRSEEKLRQGQKLEAIGKLAGGIAHDFNNILAAILGYAELSSEEVPPDHPVKTNLDQIVKASRRASDVVNQILAFSRKLDQERRPIYLHTIIDETMKLLKATFPSTIEIRTRMDPRCSPILADPTQMHQVILNLATNACHAMQQKGGVLRIELDPVWPVSGFTNQPQDLAPVEHIRLSIIDTGPGIDPEIQKRIFEPYFTTKSAGQGSGLGLAVVHGIIQSHGGTILLKSAPGQGACFEAYLPCCEEKPARPAVPAAEIVKGQGRILLIDDEEAIVNLGRRSLEKLGYSVTGETHSTRALELFMSDPHRFDLVITDQTMPHYTGISLAQEFRKLRPELPIIISSGYSDQITTEKAARMGFKAFLSKPYSMSELAKAIRQSLGA
ncbi:MAG: response regulator [Acidobacteria bacterium]|nr:response regulator [Acidobacteriota bacterium]